MRRLLKLFIIVAALGWAAYVLVRADLPAAWSALARNTSGGERWLLVAAFLLPSLGTAWLDTEGWRRSFAGGSVTPSFGRLFAARLAGEALNQSTPFLSLGGEPVKAVFAASQQTSGAESASAVAVARLTITLAQILFVMTGAALAAGRLGARGSGLAGFVLFPLGLGAGMVGAVLLLPLLAPRLRARFEARYRPKWLRAGLRPLIEALGFARTHPVAFFVALAAFFAGWALIAGEFWLVARAVGRPVTVADALSMEALINSVTMATFFIPGQLGSQEAGLMYVCRLFGTAGPVGPLMVLLRRLREVFWIAVGFLALTAFGGRAAWKWEGLSKSARQVSQLAEDSATPA